MKKSPILAACLLAFAHAAGAQGSVSVFGTVDLAFTHVRGSVASQTALTSGNYTTSRLGLRGTEDLGGGLSAGFWIEGTVQADSGAGAVTNISNQTSGTSTGISALTWNRRSTLSLAGRWGELRLGRDLMPHYINIAIHDPFAHIGIGLAQPLASTVGGPTWVRASNSLQYLTAPDTGGFFGSAAVFLGENAKTGVPTETDGNGYSLRLGYGSGPLQLSAGHMRTRFASGNVTNSSLGGSYDLGWAKPMAAVLRDEVGGAPPDGRGWQVGATFPRGLHEFKLAYSGYRTTTASRPRTAKLAAGYAFNMSRRTAIYLIAARVGNSGGAAQSLAGAVAGPDGNATGFNLGVRHNF